MEGHGWQLRTWKAVVDQLMDRKRIADLWGGELEIECTTIPEQKDLTVTDPNRSGGQDALDRFCRLTPVTESVITLRRPRLVLSAMSKPYNRVQAGKRA